MELSLKGPHCLSRSPGYWSRYFWGSGEIILEGAQTTVGSTSSSKMNDIFCLGDHVH